MKKFLISFNNKKPQTVFVVIFFALALFVRFYNFENRITFWSEQARSLSVSSEYINDKFSLLGQEYFRTTDKGHKLFSGAIFNYSLIPFLLMFNYDPLFITGYFSLLNFFTGALIFIVFFKNNKYGIGVLSSILFLFNNYMVYHSMFIWILNYMPLFGLLIYLLLFEGFDEKWWRLFLIGTLCGLCINFHYPFIPVAFFIFTYIIYKTKDKLKTLALLLLGLFLGNFTIFAFDLRHNFYHLRTLISFVLDFQKPGEGGFTYYWFLYMWPVVSIIVGKILFKVWKKYKAIALIFILGYLAFNLNSSLINFKLPTGMPQGIVYKDIEISAQAIASNSEGKYNIASTLDFDKQAYVYRYLLQYKYSQNLFDPDEYQVTNMEYVLTQKGYDLNSSDIWEVKSVCPCLTENITDVGKGYKIAKIVRI